jgi:hypothetical protein
LPSRRHLQLGDPAIPDAEDAADALGLELADVLKSFTTKAA